MAATQRQLVEDAAITALLPLRKPGDGGAASGYLRAVKPYGGEIDTANLELLRNELVGQAPGVLVATGEGTYHSRLARRRAVKDLSLELLIVSLAQRGPKERLRGGAANEPVGADPGIYKILEDLDGKLIGFDPAVAGCGLLKPHTEKPVLVTPGMTIWFKSYLFPADVSKAAVAETALTEIKSKLAFPQADETLATGVGDSLAVAGTTVTLTDAASLFLPGMLGARIEITGATNAAHNGIFTLTGGSPTTATWTNTASGLPASEPFTGTWRVRPQPAVVVSNT